MGRDGATVKGERTGCSCDDVYYDGRKGDIVGTYVEIVEMKHGWIWSRSLFILRV